VGKPNQSSNTKTSARRRVVIVDDHPLIRLGLQRLLAQKNFEVCGAASTAAEAALLIKTSKPDVVLVDVGLPDVTGIELTKQIRADFPKVRVIVFSMHDDIAIAARALRAGAAGYVDKGEVLAKIEEALHQVLAGQNYMSPAITGELGTRALESDAVARLTDREFEIFERIGKGQETRNIADELKLSIKTVEAHRVHIKAKLEIAKARELIRFATQWVAIHEKNNPLAP
jgi:DNA-binding NarL/FixJ family response regulator